MAIGYHLQTEYYGAATITEIEWTKETPKMYMGVVKTGRSLGNSKYYMPNRLEKTSVYLDLETVKSKACKFLQDKIDKVQKQVDNINQEDWFKNA